MIAPEAAIDLYLREIAQHARSLSLNDRSPFSTPRPLSPRTILPLSRSARLTPGSA